MKKLIPSPELKAIVNSRSKLLVVMARAGTGKTTALIVYAGLRRRARILYLAYNKPIQASAEKRFGSNVDCYTTHGLAFSEFGRPYQAASKLGNVRAGDVMAVFKLDASTSKGVLDVVNNYIFSKDDEISSDHVGHGYTGNPDMVLERARELWECMQSFPGEPAFNSRIKMTHDGYLKLYALSKPNLAEDYDIILLDEAQDTNPMTAELVLSQPCIRVLVGDDHQSINGYRGSTDALEFASNLPGAEVLYLTTSYRFGADVATLATALLAGYKGETLPQLGAGVVQKISPVVNRAEPYTVICRTNSRVFSTAARLLNTTSFSFVGGVKNYPFDRLVDVQNLAAGKLSSVKDPVLRQLGTLNALSEYAKNTKDLEYGALLGIQKEFGVRIPELVEKITEQALKFENGDSKEKAKVELTTAHRSKGLEFKQVELADDFEDFVTEAGHPRDLMGRQDIEELNLLYVALTRATHALQVNPSIARAMSALGQTDFCFPDGTTESAWVDSLLDSPLVVRQEVLDLVSASDIGQVTDEDDLDFDDVDDMPQVFAGAFKAKASGPKLGRP